MSTYTIAPDGDGTLTIWQENADRPELPTAIQRVTEVHPLIWSWAVDHIIAATIKAAAEVAP